MKVVLAVNLKSSFELYLLDPNTRKSQINLRSKMDQDLLTSTRKAHVYEIRVT